MGESGRAEQPTATAADGDKQGKNNDGKRGRCNHQRTSEHKGNEQHKTVHIIKEKFVGRSEDLKGFTYDVAVSKGGVAYTRTTEEITRYIGEKYTTTGSYVWTAVLTLVVPAPTRPTAPIASGTPAVIDPVEQEIFREKIHIYVKIQTAIKTAMQFLLYDLLWGQCSDSLQSRLRRHDDYTNYSPSADSMALLKAIQAEMTGFRNKQYLPHALHKIMRDFYSISQGKHRNNQEYYDEFNSLVSTAEESGATIGAHPAGITEVLASTAVDPANPTNDEQAIVIKSAAERYLAVAFMLGADRIRYGILVEEIENEYLRNKGQSFTAGTYPTTVTEAYDCLFNYKKDPKNITRLLGQNGAGNLNTGVVFAQDAEQQDSDNSGLREQAFTLVGAGGGNRKKISVFVRCNGRGLYFFS
jgi:hypothetical protein